MHGFVHGTRAGSPGFLPVVGLVALILVGSPANLVGRQQAADDQVGQRAGNLAVGFQVGLYVLLGAGGHLAWLTDDPGVQDRGAFESR